MFTSEEKRLIAHVVEETIRKIDHPEMDNDNIHFQLHVDGKQNWSFADIHENSKAPIGEQNPWNEKSREILKSIGY